MSVAMAAPATPILNTLMNKRSSIMFVTDAIARYCSGFVEFPAALSIPVAILYITLNISPALKILRYSTESSRTSLGVFIIAKRILLNITPITDRITPIITEMQIAVCTDFFTVSLFFAPMLCDTITPAPTAAPWLNAIIS